MTLLIAIILIHGFKLDGGWVGLACCVWVGHIWHHRKDDIRRQVAFLHKLAKASLKARTGQEDLS